MKRVKIDAGSEHVLLKRRERSPRRLGSMEITRTDAAN